MSPPGGWNPTCSYKQDWLSSALLPWIMQHTACLLCIPTSPPTESCLMFCLFEPNFSSSWAQSHVQNIPRRTGVIARLQSFERCRLQTVVRLISLWRNSCSAAQDFNSTRVLLHDWNSRFDSAQTRNSLLKTSFLMIRYDFCSELFKNQRAALKGSVWTIFWQKCKFRTLLPPAIDPLINCCVVEQKQTQWSSSASWWTLRTKHELNCLLFLMPLLLVRFSCMQLMD